jgi:hypothetical protein
VRHLGGQGQCDRPAAGTEVDRDRGRGCRCAQGVDRELRHHLGLGARDEDARTHREFHRAEGREAREVLQRLARAAAVDEGRQGGAGLGGETVAADRGGLHSAARRAEHVGDEELGVDLRVGDAGGGEACGGVADDAGDGGLRGGNGLGHDGSRA